jgi:3-phytase
MRRYLVLLALLWAVAAISAQETPLLEITAQGETAESPGDGAVGVAIYLHPDDLSRSLIIGTDDNEGIALYGLDGSMLFYDDTYPTASVDIRYGFGGAAALVAASVKDTAQFNLYRVDPDAPSLELIHTVQTGVPLQALCLYQSPLTRKTYVIAISERGDLEQYALAEDDGEITSSLARAVSVGGEVEFCAADDSLRRLYIAEGDNAVWRYGAEPEDGINRALVDITGPRGNITEEVEGLALYAVGGNQGYLLVSNEKEDSINVYERAGSNRFLGAFRIVTGDAADGVSEPTGMAVASQALSERYPLGLFVVADDVNTRPNANNNFKLVSWQAVAEGLGLATDTAYDPRIAAGDTASSVTVTAVRETQPVAATTDAADDPAIWVNPADPAQSTIIGTDKRNGLVVYDLSGQIIQTINIGRLNNVDLRPGFVLAEGAEPVALVGATNRTQNSLALYAVDPATRQLYDVAASPVISQVEEVYGFCMYVSPVSGDFYAFVNSADTGEVEQYRLSAADGKVQAEVVRAFQFGSQTEGCVVDDANATLYIGEEAVGIWKLGAEPDAPFEPVAVDTTRERGGNITADVEGMAIYATADGGGYLIVSSQGSDEYALYERAGENAFIGLFRVVEGAVDGTSETDGLDVSSAALGPDFPAGLLVVQDDLNLSPRAPQNFKLVDWRDVMAAFGR